MTDIGPELSAWITDHHCSVSFRQPCVAGGVRNCGPPVVASSGGPPANGRSAERISADAAVDRPALLLRLWWRGGRRGMAIKGGAPHINNGF